MPAALVGIEIGGTKLQLVAGDAQGHIFERRRFEVNRNLGAEGIREQIRTALPGLIVAYRPEAIGTGFGGPVDWRSGIIRCSHQIAGWPDFPLGPWLAQLSGLPAQVDNDANVAALGEGLHGAGRSASSLFYVTLGSGVGGGFVTQSGIYHGAPPGESEIGHVRLDRSGTVLEERCSGWAVDRRIRRAIRSHPGSGLAHRAGTGPEGGEARWLGPALEDQDPLAWEVLRETCEDLALGLSHVVHLLHPEIIVLGGGLSLLGEPLRRETGEALRRMVMTALAPGPPVRLAELGEDAVPVGALALAAQALKQPGGLTESR